MGNDSPPHLGPNLQFNLKIKMLKHKSRSEMGLLNILQDIGTVVLELDYVEFTCPDGYIFEVRFTA